MQTYNLSLPAIRQLRLVLPYPVFDDMDARLLLGAYLPGAEFTFEPVEKPTLTIVFKQSTQKKVVRSLDSRRVTVFDRWQGQPSLLDFIHLAYGACRLHWLKHGLYPVHSAFVGDLLIVGHSGAGKTSTMLRLAGKGQKVFSGNKTLLKFTPEGKLVAVAGSRTITTRADDAERHLPGFRDKLDYVGRSAFLLAPSMYSRKSEPPVKRIALTRINEGADAVEELTPLSAMHRLFAFFLDAVNADTIVCGGAAVLPGTPPRGAHNKLAQRLRPALENVRTCAVTGSMSYIETALEGGHHG